MYGYELVRSLGNQKETLPAIAQSVVRLSNIQERRSLLSNERKQHIERYTERQQYPRIY